MRGYFTLAIKEKLKPFQNIGIPMYKSKNTEETDNATSQQ